MPETHGEPLQNAQGSSPAKNDVRSGPLLTANIRRHLGHALRATYAASPVEPPGEHITGLLKRLGDAHPDGTTD